MAHLPVINGIYRCFIEQSEGGIGLFGNVINVRGATGEDPVQVARVVAEAFGGANSLCAMTTASNEFRQVHCTPLDDITPTGVHDFSTATNKAGLVGGAPFPINTTMCFSLKTGQRGRSHRGRFYLGAMSNSWSADLLHWDAIHVSTGNSVFVNFMGLLVAGSPSLQLMVASYKLASAVPVIAVATNPALCTQRMRLR